MIAAIVIFALPFKTVSYTVIERYLTTETYPERVPTIEIEEYWETEPFDKPVPIDYIVTSKGSYSYFWSTGFDVWVNIKNADLKSGIFTVVFNLTLKGGAKTTKSASKYVAIGDTEKVQVSYKGARLSSYTYSITPPTKIIIDYRQVKKTRKVPGLQEEIKQRTVWKERPVIRYKNVSLFEYLTSY